MGSDEAVESAEDRFGRRVRSERESRGWTQAELAERLGAHGLVLHPSAVAKIESRDVPRPRSIRLDEAEVIARVFDQTVDEMYESDDERVLRLLRQVATWIDLLAQFGLEGQELVAAISDLTAQSTQKVRDEVEHLLLLPDIRRIVAALAETPPSKLISKLRHPSRGQVLLRLLGEQNG